VETTVSYLKRVWDIWSELITFEWLGRLWFKKPLIAVTIGGLLISVGLGVMAWVTSSRRFLVYTNTPGPPTRGDRTSGVVFGAAAIAVAALTLISLARGRSIFTGGARWCSKKHQVTRGKRL
jgi:hypothetical protein